MVRTLMEAATSADPSPPELDSELFLSPSNIFRAPSSDAPSPFKKFLKKAKNTINNNTVRPDKLVLIWKEILHLTPTKHVDRDMFATHVMTSTYNNSGSVW